MAFRWQADDGPLLVVFGSSVSHYLKKKTTKKNSSELDPLWQNFLDPRMPLFFMADPDKISHWAAFHLGLQFAKVPVKVYKGVIVSR